MLEQRSAEKKGYITLRKAAEISGYTPDYLGQLIRAGKLEAEQVYSAVAWVTTEESVRAYMAATDKAAHTAMKSRSHLRSRQFGLLVRFGSLVFLGVATLGAFYLLSVSANAANPGSVYETNTPEFRVGDAVFTYD